MHRERGHNSVQRRLVDSLLPDVAHSHQLRLVLDDAPLRHVSIEDGLLILRLGLVHVGLGGLYGGLRHVVITASLVKDLLCNQFVFEQLLAA